MFGCDKPRNGRAVGWVAKPGIGEINEVIAGFVPQPSLPRLRHSLEYKVCLSYFWSSRWGEVDAGVGAAAFFAGECAAIS